jgi:hypothetical protein
VESPESYLRARRTRGRRLRVHAVHERAVDPWARGEQIDQTPAPRPYLGTQPDYF